MKILITGAGGLLGRRLVANLCKDNLIYAIIHKNIPEEFHSNKNVIILNKDLNDADFSDIKEKIDVVYYLAQSNNFREFPKKSLEILNINIVSPLKLANWSINNGVKKFIYASSGGIYENSHDPLKEYNKINSNLRNGYYLDSKLSAEIMLRNFSNYFETFVIARPFFIYGKGQQKSMLIPRLIENVKSGKSIKLTSKNGLKINPIHVDDAALAFQKMIYLKGEFLFNIAGNEFQSLKSICKIISLKTKREPVFEIINGDQNHLIGDNSLMKKLLCTPSITLSNGINEMIN